MKGELDHFTLMTGLFGGLALFLFGMDIMTRALERAAGDKMKVMLGKATSNRVVGVATGAVVTSVIQSSSITTVLLVGFVSSGLMSTAQSIPVILGANIGTTITAQILAFKVTKLALPIVTVGFFVSFMSKREDWRQYGLIVLGLGLVFFGMAIMSDTMKPLRTYQPFLDFMVSLSNPLLAALVGAAFTAIIQSSSAATGILIVMAGQGLIELESAIAIALGANVGTCITAGLAAIGKSREAVRTFLVHTLFNVVGVLIWIGFVPKLGELARLISPSHEHLVGTARAAAEVPRQLANVHTFFNVTNSLLFIGFTIQIQRLVEWAVPDRPLSEADRMAPRYLNEQFLSTPALALDATRREVVRLGEITSKMMKQALAVSTSATRLQLDELQKMDRPVDGLHRDIISYLRDLSLGDLSAEQSDVMMGLMKIANDLERVGDQLATNLVTSSRKRIDEGVVVSKQTAKAINGFHVKVLQSLDDVIRALDEEDVDLAIQVRSMKKDLAEMTEEIARHEILRLKADEPKRLLTYAREVETMEILNDIFKTVRRIARAQIEMFRIAELTDADPDMAEAD